MKITHLEKQYFLDISKVFDNVWHDGLIFKLESYGISNSLLAFLKNTVFGTSSAFDISQSRFSNVQIEITVSSTVSPLLMTAKPHLLLLEILRFKFLIFTISILSCMQTLDSICYFSATIGLRNSTNAQ